MIKYLYKEKGTNSKLDDNINHSNIGSNPIFSTIIGKLAKRLGK